MGAPFLLSRVRLLLTVGTVPPPSHTPSTMQLAQPSPGDFCCHPFPAPIPGLTWAPLIHEEGAGGGAVSRQNWQLQSQQRGGAEQRWLLWQLMWGGLQVTGAPTSLPIAPWH